MRRREFIAGVTAAGLLAAAPSKDIEIPVELRGGRFFAVPRVRDGRLFACWLDTDGDGFIFDATVEAFHLPVRKTDGKRRAGLPAFASPSIPPLTTPADLPIFEREPRDREDPILQGFDAQLGVTWFQGRTWRFDFPHARCTMLGSPLAAGDANVPLQIENGYTRIPVTVAGESLTMSLDIAASFATEPHVAVATTFIPQALLDRWRKTHPEWTATRNVGVVPGIDRITVPEMRAGSVTLRNVTCTTRPGDDVFGGPGLNGKLGANAFADCTVVLDYRTSRLRLC